ncbi:MAG TPA: hypothetical protein VFP58_02955, partial [Candidatus Eisenbacteria bacterium]|nr:hypothetical protein [Candidatus Eisenbacteria bacterium]
SLETMTFPDRETTIAAVRSHPLLAEPDAFQALGGGDVVLRPETPGGLHVRGGATDQTAYVLDGVPVFSPFHAAGISSAWNPDAIARLHLTSSEPSWSDPHALSGAVEATTRAPGSRLRGQATLTTTQARLTVDGPLGRNGDGYLASARLGLPEWMVPEDEPSYIRGDTADLMAKVEASLLGGRGRLLGFATENDLNAAETTELDPEPTTRRNVFEWDSHSFGIEWGRRVARGTVRVLGWSAASTAGSHWAAQTGRVALDSERRDRGLLAVMEWEWDDATASFAARFEEIDTFYRVKPDTGSASAYELDGSTPVGTVLARTSGRLGSRLDLDLRASVARARGDLWAAPRIRARWSLSERLAVVGGVSRTHQFAQSLRNPESVVGNLFPVDLFVGAAGGAPVARSDQVVLAAEYRPSPGARLEVHGYLRESEGLVLTAARTGEPFAVDGFPSGSSESRGISAEGAWNGARHGVVASYNFEDVTHATGSLRYTPEHSATHRLEGGVTFHPIATASVRFGVVAAFGRRTTISANDYEWEACNLLDQGCEFMGSPHYAGETLGGTELPDYVRVDLGVRKHWHLGVVGRDVSWAVFGTATNVFGRRNVMGYARDLSGEPYDITMRPRSPLVLGMDWAF